MVILENIQFKIFELLVAEGTTVVSRHRFLNANLAVDMATPGDVAVVDRVKTDGALEFVLEFLCIDSKVVIVEV